MAATTGLGNASTRLTRSCPALLIAVPASASLMSRNWSMSAPAIKRSFFADRRTTAGISGSWASCPKKSRSKSATAAGLSLLTGSPGRSKVRRAMPCSCVTLNADMAPSDPLEDHGEPHPALRADGDEAELDVPPHHFVREGRHDPGAGGGEGVADGDGPPHDVRALPVDVPHRLGTAQL